MMKRRVLFALLLALLCGSRAAAARIDTLSLDSRVLNRPVTVVAVLPDGASEHHPAPLLLLLHGYGGDAFSWLKIKTGLPALVDRTGIALLCPDGGQSWYMDSPVDTTSRYESFLVGELIPYADAHLPVARDARHRAVAGLSMGGFGAMRLGLLHPDLFGAAGSMSGGLDIRPFPGRWELDRLLGRQSESPENWEQMTPINLIAQLDPARTPALIIDCGYDDFIFEVNRTFHRELRRRGIPHDFCVRPGGARALLLGQRHRLPDALLQQVLRRCRRRGREGLRRRLLCGCLLRRRRRGSGCRIRRPTGGTDRPLTNL